MVILNGLVYNDKNFDSKFTYYRGRLRSQNDTILSNTVEDIKEFHIMERFIFSDHCPTALTCKVADVPSLMLIYKCSKDLFSYDHLDVNRRILPPLKINRMDITKARFLLRKGAADVKEKIAENLVDNNALCNIISNTIYIACKDSYKDTRHQDVPDIEPNLTNCNSENFKAIAHANLTTFDI